MTCSEGVPFGDTHSLDRVYFPEVHNPRPPEFGKHFAVRALSPLCSRTSQAHLLRTPTTVVTYRDARSTRPRGQRLKRDSNKAASACGNALAAGVALGKVLAVRSNHRNPREVHCHAALVAYTDY